MIINAGIKRVVYSEDYPDPTALELLKQANIEVTRFNRD
jgi:dCMP deaminase